MFVTGGGAEVIQVRESVSVSLENTLYSIEIEWNQIESSLIALDQHYHFAESWESHSLYVVLRCVLELPCFTLVGVYATTASIECNRRINVISHKISMAFKHATR